MPRIRNKLATMGAALLLVAVVSATQAQVPGGGGPGGPPGGGRGGPGGPGGFGGRGPRGGPLGLLDYPSVQTEIKLTDKQKDQIKTAKEAIAKKRASIFPARSANGNNAAGGVGGGGAAGGGNAGGGRAAANAADPNAVGGGGGNPGAGVGGGGGGRGGRGPGGGGPGGFGGFTPEMMAQMQTNMQALQTYSESIYSKILTKAQLQRLTQIDLQRQGPMAVLNPTVAQRLNISDDVLAEMNSIRDQSRQAARDAFQAQRQNAPNFMTADGQFDREAARAYRDSPEAKAAMQKMQTQRDQTEKQTIAAIGKLLSKKQKTAFAAMQGKDFDLSTLTNNPNRPPGTPPANPDAPATKADSTATAKPESATKDQTTPGAAKKGTRKTTTKRSTASTQ